jgi:hypothetical protein
MRTRLPFALLATALACSLFAAPANAQAIRTFVSVAGSDANPCTITQPCRHFSAAVAATAAGGEVDALDPGAYGSFTIGQAITIEGQGWSYVAPPANGAAITINAGPSDKINIRGVSLNGVGVAGANGIQLNSGGSLNIQDSVIRNFASRGVYFTPAGSSQIFVSNTLVADNGDQGIYIFSSGSQVVSGTLNRVIMQSNTNDGLRVTNAGKANITVSDCESSNNGFGISALATNSPLTVVVRNSSVSNTGNTGLAALGTGAVIQVTRSTLTGNNLDWSAGPGASVTSYNDNNIDGTTPPQIGYK